MAVSPYGPYVEVATTSGERETRLSATPKNANIQYQRLSGSADAGKTKTKVSRAKTSTAADAKAMRTMRGPLSSGACASPIAVVQIESEIPRPANATLRRLCRVCVYTYNAMPT